MKENSFFKVHRFDVIDSTNLKAKELAYQGNGEGTIVIAKSQTSGRGREGRLWHSPLGGLYLSVLLYPRSSSNVLELPILAGVAVVQAIREVMPKSMVISVKWPNDCLLNWKKVAGILCESLGEKASNLCVVGIGINVNIKESELSSFRQKVFSATSLMIEQGGGILNINELEEILISKLASLYSLYKEKGGEPIRYFWEKNCRLIGKQIELSEFGWKRESKDTKQQGVVIGTFMGLDQSCALILSNAKGERHLYFTGEITCYWP